MIGPELASASASASAALSVTSASSSSSASFSSVSSPAAASSSSSSFAGRWWLRLRALLRQRPVLGVGVGVCALGLALVLWLASRSRRRGAVGRYAHWARGWLQTVASAFRHEFATRVQGHNPVRKKKKNSQKQPSLLYFRPTFLLPFSSLAKSSTSRIGLRCIFSTPANVCFFILGLRFPILFASRGCRSARAA